MIILDTSGLFAALVPDQRRHDAARLALEQEPAPYLLSPFVLAELDYFLARSGGGGAELALLGEIVDGVYDLAPFRRSDVDAARTVIDRYRDLSVGLADASIVVLAGQYGTNRVLTFDERHFRALRTPTGEPFVLLPADA